MQNPVTGSGGMLLGRVREVGAEHPAHGKVKPGERIATLVSLSLTPLVIDEVRAVRMEVDRVDVRGHAILFASGIWARVPDDMPETLVLAALDVCGAPALVARHARPGMRIAVLGAREERRAVPGPGAAEHRGEGPAARARHLGEGARRRWPSSGCRT